MLGTGFLASLVAAVLLVASAGAADSARDSANDVYGNHYSGRGVGYHDMKVEFTIVNGRKRFIAPFRGRNVPLVCEDGSQKSLSFLPHTARYDPETRSFDHFRYSAGTTEEDFYFFHGQLSDDGRRATGWVLFAINYIGPGDPRADCTTAGKVYWTAKLTHG